MNNYYEILQKTNIQISHNFLWEKVWDINNLKPHHGKLIDETTTKIRRQVGDKIKESIRNQVKNE